MKILMVTRESHTEKRYGLGRSLAPLIAELTQRDITIDYLSQADAGVRSLRYLRLIHRIINKLLGRFFTETAFNLLSWGILERLNMGRLAAKVMARDRYTHVHCHDPIIAAGYRWFARIRWFMQLRQGHTARWGVTEHGFGSYTQAFHEDGVRLGAVTMRWLRRWEAKILLKAHWVITPTRQGLAQLSRDLAIYPVPSTWHAIYHARPSVNFPSTGSGNGSLNKYPKTEARQRLGWTVQSLYIIAVGRLVELKQFPNLIQAVAKLSQPVQLVLIGEGDRAPLQKLANELGIGDRLQFAVTDDMGLYYSAADIYVSTSLTESFGLANLEAMVMELPTICTAVGGVPEVVGSGAWLIPAHNPSALVQALHTLVENPALRHHWSIQAQQWATAWYGIDKIVDAYLAVYQGLALSPFPVYIEGNTTKAFLTDWQHQVQHWQPCPLPRLLTLPQAAKILVIAPHPDDETLGCGGTLALLRQNHCQIKVIMATDGSKGDPLGYSHGDVVQHRQRELLAALQVLGIDDVVFLGQPDGDYQHTQTVATHIETILNEYAPDWLLLPSVLDYHRDHVAVSLSALTSWEKRGCRERLFCYEIWAALPATWVVDISTVFALKQQAIRCYELPLKYGDYLTGCTGMASYRGLYLTRKPDGQYAEAFLELDHTSWQTVLTHLLSIRAYQEQQLT